jgi:hypothetical protein
MAPMGHIAIIAGVFALMTGVSGPDIARAQQEIRVEVVSSRPEVVSGGDVLVKLGTPAGSGWSAQLNGRLVVSFPEEALRHRLSFIPGPQHNDSIGD